MALVRSVKGQCLENMIVSYQLISYLHLLLKRANVFHTGS